MALQCPIHTPAQWGTSAATQQSPLWICVRAATELKEAEMF